MNFQTCQGFAIYLFCAKTLVTTDFPTIFNFHNDAELIL